MNKLKLVAKHEFWKLVKSKSFIIMTLVIVLLPILGGAVLGGIAYVSGMSSSSAVGYVDHSGLISDVHNVDFFRCDSEESAKRALVAGEISGYYIIPEDYVDIGEIYWYFPKGSLLIEVDRMNNDIVIRESLVRGLTQGYVPTAVVERVSEPPDVKQVTVDGSGLPVENQGVNESFAFGIAIGFVFIIIVMTPAGYLLTGLVQERENRVMEVLLSSVSPRQLLMGKVIGIGVAGLTQILVVVVGDIILLMFIGSILGGFLMANSGVALAAGGAGGLELGGVSLFPQGIGMFLGMGVVYFLLGYLLFTAVLTMVGVMCNVKEQASQWQVPLLFVCGLPIFASLIWGGNPSNIVMVGMGMFPLTAPLTMIIRLSYSVIPAWELAASVGLMALTIGVLFWVMPRLVRGETLILGRSFSLKRLIGWKGR